MGNSNSKHGEFENYDAADISWRSKLVQDHTQIYTAEYQSEQSARRFSTAYEIVLGSRTPSINRNPSRTLELELHPSETDADRDVQATARVTQDDHAACSLQIDATRPNVTKTLGSEMRLTSDAMSAGAAGFCSVPGLKSAQKGDETRQETVSSGRIAAGEEGFLGRRGLGSYQRERVEGRWRKQRRKPQEHETEVGEAGRGVLRRNGQWGLECSWPTGGLVLGRRGPWWPTYKWTIMGRPWASNRGPDTARRMCAAVPADPRVFRPFGLTWTDRHCGSMKNMKRIHECHIRFSRPSFWTV
jgi:hypothetical protein